jgi:hypothetical protein
MPPVCVGAMRHSRRLTGSGMSKDVSVSSASARSDVSCIHRWSASVPDSFRAGSASSRSMASAVEVPAPYSSAATASCSAVSRATSSRPQAYVSSRSTAAPRKYRELSAYRSRPTASLATADPASSESNTSASAAYAARAASAPLARSAARAADGSAPSGRAEAANVVKKLSASASFRDCSTATRTCRRVSGRPEAAWARSDSVYPARAEGIAATRAAMFAQFSSVSVGMRSRTSRTYWTGEWRLLTGARSSPASCLSTARPSRSRIASSVATSTSSTGSSPSSSARVARLRSARAATPSGLRSGSSWSWPGRPMSVASMGSRAMRRSTYRSATASMAVAGRGEGSGPVEVVTAPA